VLRAQGRNGQWFRLRCCAFGGEDTGDGGEVVGDEKVCPFGRFEQRANGGERVVAKFEDEEAARFEVARGFGHKPAVNFVAFFAAVEGGGRFVVADFRGKG